ncbi:MAG: alpha-2-macroglobulin family protein [Bacteroidia bacterium]|nr:alpha-2-macroglobulin family protein [Bacteroidia bacterium]
MKKLLMIAIAGIFFLSLQAQTKQTMNYDQAWKKVAELEQKSLPKSAAEEVNSILRKAIAEKNSPQTIKALIHQGKYNLAIDAQNDTVIFRNLADMLAKSTDVVEKSVLHSMLGELYLQYYQKGQWQINQRTALIGFVPADMKEWSKNNFYDKVVEHLNASIKERAQLEKAQVQPYEPVVTLGKDSRRFYPTMYDFLARRAIEFFNQIDEETDLSRSLAKKNIVSQSLFAPSSEFIKLNFDPQPEEYNLWALETYKKHLASLSNRNLNTSVILSELNKLDYLAKLRNAHQQYASPLLQSMLKKWENDPISVEIVDKIADFYTRQIAEFSQEDSVKRLGKTKELYELLQTTIRKFPKYERISILENRLLQLTQPNFQVKGNNTFAAKAEKTLTVEYKNLKKLTAKLYRLDSSFSALYNNNRSGQQKNEKKTLVREIEILLASKQPYESAQTDFTLNVSEFGSYKLEFESDPATQKENNDSFYFSVSDLAVFSRLSAKNKYEFFVVNRTSGEPVKNARVNIYKLPGNWYNSALVLETAVSVNELGLAVYNKNIPNNDVFYQVVSGSDNGSVLNQFPWSYYYEDSQQQTSENVNIFTDRSLYRPGQTVYFKAIATTTTADKAKIIPNKSIEFILRDANYQEVSKQTLKTNEFGSVSGEFILPQGTLTGHFNITTSNGNAGFRVEEYKRPTFEVTFDKIEKTYKFGEEITLKGKAENYSGIKLQNANVSYRITRQQSWWWRWGGPPEHFVEGVATTDENGEFEITFTPEKADEGTSSRAIYSFNVEATVTDVNGETQVGNYSVTVGDISMMLNVEMPDQLEKSSADKIVISAKNLDGNGIKSSGTYQVFSLHENDSVNTQVLQGNFETGEQTALKEQLKKLPSAKYRIKLQSKDDRGNEITVEKDFVLFAYSDKRPPIKTNEWFVVKNNTFSSDKPAEIILGATDNLNVLYELWRENTLLERKWVKINNENRLFTIPYKPEYKTGVMLMLTYVKDEKLYVKRTELLLEKEKTGLDVKLDVFRNKIRPGTQEEWRISIADTNRKPVLAEVLAGMYDFSLDQIYPSQKWELSLPFFYNMMVNNQIEGDESFELRTINGYIVQHFKNVSPFVFDRFNWFDFSLYRYGRMMMRSAKAENVETMTYQVSEEKMLIMQGGLNLPPPPLPPYAPIAIQMEDASGYELQKNVVKDLSAQEESKSPQIRRNFNETAFFFPQLRTNDKGETQIAFTVPESNTKWRFRVLAHDKNLNTGEAEAFTTSQKELMITPNMPRFLRHGDKTSISTKITNLSEGAVSGNVRIEFFNPTTEEMVSGVSIENQSQSFTLEQNASSDALWTFNMPSDIDIIGVRIVAQSASFSDGEQHALVVLPNQMLVTEAIRIDVNGKQTKEFEMDRLVNKSSSTIQDYRLTLEFTSNPAWYAVQALPVLSAPESDNAVSWFASYYANTLGTRIGKAYPKVSAMIEAWKKQGGDSETLLSNLEKNQELKAVLLEETPWVLEAKNESEQKQKLSLLFDLNRNRNLTRQAIDKLKELQTSQGGWSWFKGFYPSRSITQYILYGFNQLKELKATEFTDEIRTMQSQAVSYIDSEAIRSFEQLKKFNKDWRNLKTIPISDLEYLYIRSNYGQYPLDANTKEMVDFYTSVIEKNWTQFDLYERSLITVLMQKNGKQNIVQDILKSYREHATVSDEMGMFWANNRAHVFMSQSAVSVHTFIMDAFRISGAKSAEMDNMKRWLLKQKQTQLWESTHATMDAVYALLSTGSDWFSSENKTTVTVADKVIEPAKQELGTGYFKETWHKSEITPQMGQVIIENSGNAPAWGALYWQYYEDLDKISKTDASLDVEKLLFVEKTDASGTKLIPVTENSPLKVGDKVIVRLTVRTDRDLEFVHLKDMRAAAFEPVEQLSGVKWQGGTIYYQTSKDASTNFYFDTLPRGTYVFEYGVFVTRTGDYSNGITTIQCMYAPEFTSHTAGIRVRVNE